MNSPTQLPFEFDHRPSLGDDDFMVASNNQEAVAWLDKWPDWPSPFLVIYGPPGCGKTHLCHVFMAKTSALQLTPNLIEDAGLPNILGSTNTFVVDDGDQGFDEEILFHCYNDLISRNAHLLITAQNSPQNWQFSILDLASRLKASPAIEIGLPEDDVIKAIMAKMFSDRQVLVDAGVIDYVTVRMERSLEAARRFVDEADKIALAEKKGITLAIARKVIGNLTSEA